MTSPSNQTDVRALALEVAGQLRLEAVQLADAGHEQRRARYRQIVQEADHRVPPSQKPEFYRTLREWVPAWVDAPSSSPAVAVNGIDPDDLQGLLARVVALVGTDPAKSRQTVEFLSRSLGVETAPSEPPPAEPGLPPEVVEQLAKLLGAKPETMEVSTVVAMLPRLLQLAMDLDKVAWSVWASMSTGSTIRRDVELQQTLARSATGAMKLTPQQVRAVSDAVAKLSGLTVGLVTQLEQAGAYAQEHYRQVSPGRVETAVKESGRSGILRNNASMCWEHFAGLFDEIDSDAPRHISRSAARSIEVRLGRSI